MTAPDPRARLLTLLRDRAVLHGDFVLSSGQRSNQYLDARIVTLSAEGSRLVGELLFDLIRNTDAEAVAGLTLGADPMVTAIALISGQQGHPIDGLIVRKEQKEHGAGRRIEGPWREGLRVAIVEDTLTTGASSLLAADAVTAAGGTVVGIYGLIDRDQGAREAINARGYSLHALFTGREVLSPS